MNQNTNVINIDSRRHQAKQPEFTRAEAALGNVNSIGRTRKHGLRGDTRIDSEVKVHTKSQVKKALGGAAAGAVLAVGLAPLMGEGIDKGLDIQEQKVEDHREANGLLPLGAPETTVVEVDPSQLP